MHRLVVILLITACATLPDFPLLAMNQGTPPPVGDPLHGCAVTGETLGACVDFPTEISGAPATTVRACEFTPVSAEGARRLSIRQAGKTLACVVMTDLARWDAKGAQLFSVEGNLLLFKHHAYASDVDRYEILLVGPGEAHAAYRGHWLNLRKLEDLDGDGIPELTGWENAPQNQYCDYVPTAVFALRGGRFVRDDAAMERFAKKHDAPWWGPEPIIDGSGPPNPFTTQCREKLRLLREKMQNE
jgi:hypothetical protein